jgi:hypothetical protein
MKLLNPAEEKLAAVVLNLPAEHEDIDRFAAGNIEAGCLTRERADAVRAWAASTKTGDSRFDSLIAILPDAKRCAAEHGVTICVLHAPIYVDEFEIGEHVYGARDACEIMYPKREGMNDPADPRLAWHIDATVEPNGEVFFTRVDDILGEVALKREDVVRKINVQVLP